MGTSRDSWPKSSKTRGRRKPSIGGMSWDAPLPTLRLAPATYAPFKFGGGGSKCCALRLDVGNLSWDSKCCTHKTRIVEVVRNTSNNHLAHTKPLVKNWIVFTDRTRYPEWYGSPCALLPGRKKGTKLVPEEKEILNKKRSKKMQEKYDERKKNAKISSLLGEAFQQGEFLARMASGPGQCGPADGCVLEGKELDSHLRKIKAQKGI